LCAARDLLLHPLLRLKLSLGSLLGEKPSGLLLPLALKGGQNRNVLVVLNQLDLLQRTAIGSRSDAHS
jgi:hypothetical protein